MKLLLELRTLPCYLSRGPFHILNIRNSEPGKQIEQTDLWAIKNNSLLKYFQSPRWGRPWCWWWDASSLCSAPAVTTRTSWSGQSSTTSLASKYFSNELFFISHVRNIHPADVNTTTASSNITTTPSNRTEPPPTGTVTATDDDDDFNITHSSEEDFWFLINPVFLPHTKCLKNKKIS